MSAKNRWLAAVVVLAVLAQWGTHDGAVRPFGAACALVAILAGGLSGALAPVIAGLVTLTSYRDIGAMGVDARSASVMALGLVVLVEKLHQGVPRAGNRRLLWVSACALVIVVVDVLLRPSESSLGLYLGRESVLLALIMVFLSAWMPANRGGIEIAVGFSLAGVLAFQCWQVFQLIGRDYAQYLASKFGSSDIASSNYVAVLAASIALGVVNAAIAAKGAGRLALYVVALGTLSIPALLLSRSALVAFCLGVAVLTIRRREWTLVLLLGCLLAVAIFSDWSPAMRLQERFVSLSQDLGSGRSELYQMALQRWESNVLVGLGGTRLGPELSAAQGVQYVHSLPIEYLARYGILGVVPMVGMWVVGVASVYLTVPGSIGLGIILASLMEPAGETYVLGTILAAMIAAGYWVGSCDRGRDDRHRNRCDRVSLAA